MKNNYSQNDEPADIARRQEKRTMAEYAKVIEGKSKTALILDVVFKGRITRAGNQNIRLAEQHFYENGSTDRVANDLKGSTFSRNALSTSYSKTIRMLGFKYLTDKQRGAGVRMWNIPFFGGNAHDGTFNHIHALIAVPFNVDLKNFKERVTNIFIHQMKKSYRDLNPSRIQSDVYFGDEYHHKEGAYLYYCSRLEGIELESGSSKIDVMNAYFKHPITFNDV